ncbi:hypothetical protein BKA63DRAFT_21129 [Paraphoma chrysanthemicola]|nr:hypothetical protein BKA63DRAFT_21129 [Paraphoma chrysanthemicola]
MRCFWRCCISPSHDLVLEPNTLALRPGHEPRCTTAHNTYPVCFSSSMSASCSLTLHTVYSSTIHPPIANTSLRVSSDEPSSPHLHLTIPVQHLMTLLAPHSPAKSPKKIALLNKESKATLRGCGSRGVEWGNTRERGCRTVCARVTDTFSLKTRLCPRLGPNKGPKSRQEAVMGRRKCDHQFRTAVQASRYGNDFWVWRCLPSAR